MKHHLAVILLVWPTAALAAPASSPADTLLMEAEQALEKHESRIAGLEAKVPTGTSKEAAAKVQSRIDEGLIYHQLKEWGRAATVLFDVVEAGAHTTHAGYPDAVFYLADALYQTRNLLAAERYFKLVVQGGHQRYLKDSLLRLIEISLTTHPQEDVDPYFERLRTLPGAAADPRLVYIHAKALFFQDKTQAALDRFLSIQPDAEPFLQARYFASASLVQLGRHEDALNTLFSPSFRTLWSAQTSSPMPSPRSAGSPMRKLARSGRLTVSAVLRQSEMDFQVNGSEPVQVWKSETP